MLFRSAKPAPADPVIVAKAVGELLVRGDHKRALAAILDLYRGEGPAAAGGGRLDKLLRGAVGRARKLAADERGRNAAAETLAAVVEALLDTPFGGALADFPRDEASLGGFGSNPRLAPVLAFLSAIRAFRAGEPERAAGLIAGIPAGSALARPAALIDLLTRFAAAAEEGSAPGEVTGRIAALDSAAGGRMSVPAALVPETIRLAVVTGSKTVEGWLRAELQEPAGRALQAFFAALERRDWRETIAAVKRIEEAGIGLPQPAAARILIGLVEETLPAPEIADAVATAGPGPSRYLLTVAVLALAGADRYEAARELLGEALRAERTSWDASSEAFARLDYLIALYAFVIGSARRKTLPLHAGDPVLDAWKQLMRATLTAPAATLNERLRAFDYLLRLDRLKGADAEAATLVEVAELVLGVPELRREPRILARIAAISGKARFVAAELPADYLAAVGAALPRGIAPVAGADTGAIVRLLEYAGRSDEVAVFADGLAGADAPPEERFAAAVAAMRTSARASRLAGASVVEQLYESGAIPGDGRLDAVVEAKLRLARLDGFARMFATPDALGRIGSASKASVVGRHLFGARATAAFLRRAALAAAVRVAENARASDLNDMLDHLDETDECDFLAETNAVVNTAPQPTRPQAAIAVMAEDGAELALLPLVAFAELRRRGTAVFSLFPGLLDGQPTGIAALDHIQACLGPRRTASRWHRRPVDLIHEWRLDLPGGVAECRGVNFFTGLNEALCLTYRRFTIDYRNRLVADEAMDHIVEMDLMVAVLDRLKAVAAETGVPIRIFLPQIHFGWRFAVRAYVNAITEDGDLSVFQSTNGYENYVKNFSSPYAGTLAVRDMTGHAALSSAYVPPPEAFDRWCAGEWAARRAELDRAEGMIRISRVVRTRDESKETIAALAAERAAGRRVACLFGKVLFDQAVPATGGPAHRDMRDWFDHAIATAAANPGLLLLIKPHPHEVRDEIALYPTELLSEWLPEPSPPNVRFLPHNLLNLHEVAEVLDLGIVWNGSAAVELGILGVPTLVCGEYGGRDYPVGQAMPRDRAHFERLLTHPEEVPAGADIADRCRAYLAYTQGPEISIPYRYTRRTLTNQKVPRQGWFAEDLAAWEREGDPYVDFIARRIEGEELPAPRVARALAPA